MKKQVIASLIFMTLVFPLFAQNKKRSEDFVQQFVLPKEVTVGDKVQLHYTFNSAVDFFALAESEHISGDVLYLNPMSKPFSESPDRFTINEISLLRSGMSYTLLVSFIPWTTGEIVFDDFDLSALSMGRDGTLKEESVDEEKEIDTLAVESGINPAPYKITLDPVTVVSLSNQLNVVGLRPPVSPLLLPGTKYVLWTLIVVGVVLLFAVCFILAKIRSIREAWFNLQERLGLVRMSNLTKRKLKKLSTKKCSDAEFAAEWQQIMRSYLKSRFDVPFDSVTTKRISSVIFNKTVGMLTETKEDAIFNIVSLFTRTDYIIFAQNSIDSKQLPLEVHEAAFNEGERLAIVDNTGKAIEGLEKVEDEKDGGME